MRTREMKAGINRGIKLLDKRVPDWRDKIDLEDLDLGYPCSCILGQSTGSYYTTIDVWDIEPNYYGFSIPYDNKSNTRNFAKLTQLWKEELS